MATRKAIALVSGLFQEVNTPTDKLDFAGNTTTDLAEGTKLYYTDARVFGALSVSNTGTGYGSLAYSTLTGAFTYTVVTDANIRGSLSVASGSGLTYSSLTGQFGTSAIPNSQLANSSVTLGSTSVSLGGTASTITDLSFLLRSTVITSQEVYGGSYTGGGVPVAGTFVGLSVNGVIFNTTPLTAASNTTFLRATAATPTVGRYIYLPDADGTVALLNSISVANSGTGFGSLSYNSGTGAITYSVVTEANIRGTLSASTTGTGYGALAYNSSTGIYAFAVVTDANIRGSLSVAVGSGLTYSSSTGVFGTSAIPNSQLANSNVQIGSTSIALGGTTTTVAGLTSLTATSLYGGTLGAANSVYLDGTASALVFQGTTASAFTTRVVVTNPTATRTVTLQNATGTVALSTNNLSFFAATTSAQLAGVLSDETGSGSAVFATSPSLTTPSLGVASATSINKVAITAPATGSTLTIANGKTLTASNTLTFAGTDGSTVTFGVGGTVAYLGANNAFTGANTFTNTTGQTFRQTSTQDGIILKGRAGGSSSYASTLTPETLTANRTLTLPDETATLASQDFATAIAIALG
jgi:hypothetical protein